MNAVQHSLRTLLVEDSEDDAELVLRFLKRTEFDIFSKRVDTYEATRAALLAYPWDLVLTDHAMPSFSSAGVLELLQELRPNLPCIVVSGAIGEEAAVALMQKGAADYVNKGKLSRLDAAVTRALREAEARRARAEAEEALARERDFLRTVLDNITDGIVVSDEAGRIVMVNHAASEFYGGSEGRFQGLGDGAEQPPSVSTWAHNFFESDGVTKLPQERVPICRALGGERVREAELVVAVTEGAPRVLSANAQRLKDAAGRTIGAVMATHDVTERKEFEESIRRRAAQQEVVANLGQRAIAGAEPQALMGEAVVWVTRALSLPLGEVLELPSTGSPDAPPGAHPDSRKNVDKTARQADALGASVGFEGGAKAREADGIGNGVRTSEESRAGYLVRRAGVGWGARGAETGTRERAGERVRGAGRAEVLKQLPAAAQARGAVGGIRAPVRSRGKTYGILGVYDTQARTYRPDEVAFVGTVADVLAEAVARKEAEAALRARNERLALLSEMANQLLLANEPQKFVSSLFAKLSAHLGLEIYLNYLVDEDETGRRLRLASSEGLPEDVVKELEWLEFGEGVVGAVARSQRAVFVEDVQKGSQVPAPLPPLRSLGLGAYACLPLLAHGRLIGTLSFGTRGRTHFAADELTVMELACNQVAMALELSRQTQNDELTGLPNRRAFDRTLEREMALSRRHARALGLLVLDLDHFKRVNDEHGHDAGDEVLRELSMVVRANVRSSDLLARWGGEEFVLVAPHADLSQLSELGERIRGAVAAHPFKTGPMTVSLGGTDFSPRDNAKRLFARADDALYKAKQAGRNRLVLKAAEQMSS